MQKKNPVRVRFAPSPTGRLHLGGGRTALYNYLLARQTGGKFILRIEDTDRKRFVPGAEEELMVGLKWMGLDWDEGPDIGGDFGPYRQSERKEIYLNHARLLIESGNAYYCFCQPERLVQIRQEQMQKKAPLHYDGLCRGINPEEARQRVESGEPHVIRFKTPQEGQTTVHDELRGDIVVENASIDDFVLVKSDGWALYHLAAIVDDHLMKITHVFRGAEWLPTFPLHGLIHRAFGWNEPKWVHLSVFLKPSGKGKMSKREAGDLIKDGHSIFIKDLEELGYLPEAVDNWIALMGWSYDDRTEIFTLGELVEKFGIESLNPSPAAINFSKLDYFNGVHIRNLPLDNLVNRIKPYFSAKGYEVDESMLHKIAPIIRERMVTLDDAVPLAGFFFEGDPQPVIDDLVPKSLSPRQVVDILTKSLDIMGQLPETTLKNTEPSMRQLVTDLGLEVGQVFGVLRVAITGKKVSPPLFESIEIIGKQKTLRRLKAAIALIEKQ